MADTTETFKVPEKVPSLHPVNSLSSDESVTKSDDAEKLPEFKEPNDKTEKKSLLIVPLPYKEPEWTGTPPCNYCFEIIKNGTVVSNLKVEKSLIVFGRLDVCDIIFEHPSVSRYHAVVQYCKGDDSHPKGFYLQDLGSTHGTFLNKDKVKPNIYYKLKVGYVLKFGGSSRLHIFQGPEEQEEKNVKMVPKKMEGEICDWGMGEDAEEEEDLAENPFALSTPNEELYLDDPKKTLRSWFEREGYELEYDVEERGFKNFSCRIQLPVDTPTGEFMSVEASVSGKKKEAVVACALEACRTLDRLGLLRQSQQESRHRKKKKWEENDYYDSDEDTFLDRTGTIEKKREIRKRIEKKTEVETFQTLEAKLKHVTDEMDEVQSKLSDFTGNRGQSANSVDGDSLELFMSSLSDSSKTPSDKIERKKLKFRLNEAEKEKVRLEKLLDFARPAKLPPVVKHPGIIGKKLKTKLILPSVKPKEMVKPSLKLNENGEEIEEDESDEDKDNLPAVTEHSQQEVISGNGADAEELQNTKIYGLSTLSKSGLADDDKSSKGDKQLSITSTESISPNTTKRTIGPEKPAECKETEVKAEEDIFGSSAKRKRKSHSKKRKEKVDIYTTGNSDYSTWVPPSGQTGDGITHLNQKFGY